MSDHITCSLCGFELAELVAGKGGIKEFKVTIGMIVKKVEKDGTIVICPRCGGETKIKQRIL